MGEAGRQDANADSRLPRFPVFVACNPGNSARVAIEDAALKGRRYKGKRKNKEDGALKGRRCDGKRKNKRSCRSPEEARVPKRCTLDSWHESQITPLVVRCIGRLPDLLRVRREASFSCISYCGESGVRSSTQYRKD